MARPIRAEISASALRHNYRRAKELAPNASALAVVKANAYGHGVERVAAALHDADGFATLELESAEILRARGISSPILMLEGFFEASELKQFAHLQLMAGIHDAACLQQLANASLSQPLDVFLKFNTGMNRLGFGCDSADALQAVEVILNAANRNANIRNLTLMTHFASADAEGSAGEFAVERQVTRFSEVLLVAKKVLDVREFKVSMANSAATLRHSIAHQDWVRPGIMLYGSSPFTDESATELNLKPAMTFSSEIIAIQELRRGDAVGYGATYVANQPMRIGIVACGYADGYPRHAPGGNNTGTPILVDGIRTRTVGRVSMDMLAVDLSPIPKAQVGSKVTLWGQDLSADEVAQAAGTIAYELFCAIAPRVRMVSVA